MVSIIVSWLLFNIIKTDEVEVLYTELQYDYNSEYIISYTSLCKVHYMQI